MSAKRRSGGAAGGGGEEDEKPVVDPDLINMLRAKYQRVGKQQASGTIGTVIDMSATVVPAALLVEDKNLANKSTPISLIFKCQKKEDVFFKVKRSIQLRKLMTAYCKSQSMDINAVRFLLDGRRIPGLSTPDELKMQDGDEIDVMVYMVGGGVGSAFGLHLKK